MGNCCCRPEINVRDTAFKRGTAYLERYCLLIAFTSYLERTKGSDITFQVRSLSFVRAVRFAWNDTCGLLECAVVCLSMVHRQTKDKHKPVLSGRPHAYGVGFASRLSIARLGAPSHHNGCTLSVLWLGACLVCKVSYEFPDQHPAPIHFNQPRGIPACQLSTSQSRQQHSRCILLLDGSADICKQDWSDKHTCCCSRPATVWHVQLSSAVHKCRLL